MDTEEKINEIHEGVVAVQNDIARRNLDDYVTNSVFIAHAEEDAKNAESFRESFKTTHENFIKMDKKLEKVATADDIKELKEFMKRINVGVGFFKFTFANASQIGSLLLFLFAIGLFIKYGIIGIIAWFMPK